MCILGVLLVIDNISLRYIGTSTYLATQEGPPLIDKAEALKYIEDKPGEVSEWSKEAVLKTVELQGSVGSNPTFSGS